MATSTQHISKRVINCHCKCKMSLSNGFLNTFVQRGSYRNRDNCSPTCNSATQNL